MKEMKGLEEGIVYVVNYMYMNTLSECNLQLLSWSCTCICVHVCVRVCWGVGGSGGKGR